ncbi:hypothetical protein TH25_20180 [Thalassospira profundimaris]|uniref:Uncharacterized protein n=1 Tax=Thalassospira profundimaris TaxID=502049 RepID=A0A367WRI7_9PROT|nr:hypothetical protein TH25_20180 [Thalassospira profundimaris]
MNDTGDRQSFLNDGGADLALAAASSGAAWRCEILLFRNACPGLFLPRDCFYTPHFLKRKRRGGCFFT